MKPALDETGRSRYLSMNIEFKRELFSMTRRRIIISFLFALAAGFLIYILFPLTSRKWDIIDDPEKIAEKKRILDAAAHASGKASGYGSDTEDSPFQRGGRPNIILILADDLGKTDISLYGGVTVFTPNIDSIGRDGVTFTNAYCTASICSPSRSSMLTGRYQQRFGNELQIQERYPKHRLEYVMYKYFVPTGEWRVRDLERYPNKTEMARQGPPLSEIMLPELLKTAGYKTGLTGKWHQGWAEEMVPNSRGFDYQYGFYEAYSLYETEDSPGVVNSPHAYFADKHIWHRGRKGTCAVMRNGEVVEENRYLTFAIADEACAFIEEHKDNPFFLYVPFSAPHTPFQAPADYYDQFESEPDHNKRVYYAMIKALDDAVGRILASVGENGLAENTLILFASDNGGAVYTGATLNSPYKGGKFTLYEGGLAIPFMMKWPGMIKEKSNSSRLVSLMDVFATCAGAAGIPAPAERHFDSVNLLNADYLVSGPGGDGTGRRALYFRSGFNKAVREGDWKLVIFGKDARTELYNIAADKEEAHNVADAYPEIAVRLACLLKDWEAELPPPLWPSVMDYRTSIGGREYSFQL